MTYEVSFLGKQLPSEAATRHFAFLGTTGAGKTLALKILMNSVLHYVGAGVNHRALIYDAKKDMHSILQSLGINLDLVQTFNPFDNRCVGWNMAEDIDSPAAALELANILVPQKEESQPFFTDATRDLLSGVILSFIINYPRKWTFRDLLLTMRSRVRICEILTKGKAANYVSDRTMYFANEKTSNSIMATIRTKLSSYEIIAALWENKVDEKTGQVFKRNKISLRNWVDDRNGSILLLGASEINREALDVINRVLFKRLTQLVLDQTEEISFVNNGNQTLRRTWFILDELRMLGNLSSSGLGSLFTQGRSKGVCVAITLQDIDGMRAIYGESETNEILAQCNSKIILQLSSPSTAKWASELAGKMRRAEKDRNESWTTVGHTAEDSYTDSKQSARVQISESDKLVERDRILAGEFLDRPVTNRENGMHGFFMTPYSNNQALRQGINFRCESSTINSLLVPKNQSRQYVYQPVNGDQDINFYPRQPEDQFLENWSPEELREKNLMDETFVEDDHNDYLANKKLNLEKAIKTQVERFIEERLRNLRNKENN